MTTGYGISGIGYPMMGLGNLGLGGVSSFSSYDAYMPSSMGMGYGMGYGMMSPYGMGMLNPAYMAQMQGQMETYQLNHAANMQQLTLNHEVQARDLTNSALVKKILSQGSIDQGIQNLYAKVKERDMDGVCEEFDRLKTYIMNNYSKEIQQYYHANPEAGVAEVIENLYASVISKQEQRMADLRSDIKQYGDDAFRNGFMRSFKEGHSEKYTDEALNHCFGLSINHKGQQDNSQCFGAAIGGAAHSIKMGAMGATGGMLGFSIINLLGIGGSLVLPKSKTIVDAAGKEVRKLGLLEGIFKNAKNIKLNEGEKLVEASRTMGFSFKGLGKVALVAGLGFMVFDLGKQIYKLCTKDKENKK